ncbi:unnamed protein product [Lactuca saligna]|uniref:Uncharacterized protein n=1 Tax=Lactuca saligna TaxID=75948 RepID=A0AA36DVC8_LACSI|nr:unnamed protein product [Lactuca saligna]
MKMATIEDWKSINWCKYLNNVLPHNRISWNPRNNDIYYAGPLPFLLLLYLHSSDCQNKYISRKIRPICYWNYGKIKSRQNIEKAQRPLGLVILVEDVDLIQYKDEEDVYLIEEKGKGKQVEEYSYSEENDQIGAEKIAATALTVTTATEALHRFYWTNETSQSSNNHNPPHTCDPGDEAHQNSLFRKNEASNNSSSDRGGRSFHLRLLHGGEQQQQPPIIPGLASVVHNSSSVSNNSSSSVRDFSGSEIVVAVLGLD